MSTPVVLPHQAPTRRARAALLAILALGLGLRLIGYTESVWIDELFTSDFFCGHPLVLSRTLFSDIHPPLYFVFIHFWNRVFGDGEVWLRLPALLSGLASLVLVVRIGERYANRATGLVAGALLALSPVHVWYSQEARPYSTNLLLLLVAVYAYQRRLEDPRRRWSLLFAAGLFGIVFTHYYMAAYLVVFPMLALLDRETRKRGLVIASAAVGALLVVYMGLKSSLSHVPTAKKYLRAFDLGEAWDLGFDWFLTGKSFTPRLVEEPAGTWLLPVLQVLALGVFARGAWKLARGRERRGHHLLVHLSVLPACLYGMTLIGLSKTYIERSALPALPFFLLVLASGLTGWRHRATNAWALATTAVACLLVLTFGKVHARDWTVYKPNPDWKGVARFLGQRIDRGDVPGRLYSAYLSPSALTYYDERIWELKYFERNDAKVEAVVEKCAAVFGVEGFPGEWIQRTLRENIEGLDDLAREAREGTRIGVRWLGEEDPLSLPASQAPVRFWLLVHGQPDERARNLLSSGRTHALEQHEFADLTLYELVMARDPRSADFGRRGPR